MSGLNTYFIPLTILQEQFWDKLTDAPLAGGKLYFYQDEARTIPKSVYVLTGNPPDYTYAVASPSDSSITLSSIGTVDDSMGNNLVIYGYPYDDTDFDGSGNIELYYMTVYSSDGIFQFSVGGFPNVPFEEGIQPTGQEKNFIKNGQFMLNNGTQPISATTTEVAYGGWNYTRSSNTATDVVSFTRFGSPIAGGVPSGNPRYACNVACSTTGADSSKVLEARFNDVNRFSDPSQTLSLFFMAKSSSASSITVNLYKNFGSGGSSPIITQIVDSTTLSSSWEAVRVSFPFGSNVGYTLGANDDDYFSIQVSFNPALTFNVSVTDFVLYLGTEDITEYPLGVDSYNDAQINNINTYIDTVVPTTFNTINVKTYLTSGVYIPTAGMKYCTIECMGGGGAGGGITGNPAYAMGSCGGGAGAYARKTVDAATIGALQTVTVAAGGTPGAPGNYTGNTGGASGVGLICIAYGGSGGGALPGAIGNGGTAFGDITSTGEYGQIGMLSTSTSIYSWGGGGGNTAFGAGGIPPVAGSAAYYGFNGVGYGSGGSGATSHGTGISAAGGAGAPGFVIITEYIFTP